MLHSATGNCAPSSHFYFHYRLTEFRPAIQYKGEKNNKFFRKAWTSIPEKRLNIEIFADQYCAINQKNPLFFKVTVFSPLCFNTN